MSVQGRARLCALAPVFHLQDVGQNVGDGPVKLKRNLLVHLRGVVNRARQSRELDDAPRDKCTLSCAINGIHAAFHYLKKNYISGCVMTVPTG